MRIGNLDKLDQEIADNPTIENVEKRRALQELLDQAEEGRGRLAMIRSGARWLEEGENLPNIF